jgi:hypothetical protein
MGDELVPVHLGTGEVLDDLGRYDPEVLAEALVLLRERKSELEAMRKAIDTELAKRLTERGLPRGRVWVIGDFGLKFKGKSEWDADELEGVLRNLLDEGQLTSRDVLGLIEHVPKVNGRNVDRLLKRTTGETRNAINQCRRWASAGLAVEREQPLLPGGEEGE